MKITSITAHLMGIPGPGGHSPARNWIFVRVETDEGVVGLGEATTEYHELAVMAMIEGHLADLLVGQDPTRINYIWQQMRRFYWWRDGVVATSAASGIDQALWDIKGKALNAPVCALLGGPRSAKVPVYSHFGGRDIPAMVDNAQRVLDEGFNALKSGISIFEAKGPKISREQLRHIDERYTALRQAIGDDIEIMDDPHAYFDPPSALEIARLLEPYRLLFFEEPTIPEDHEGYARIRQGTSTPIAGSERLTSKHRFNDYFRAGAVDVAQPDIVYIGGITEMKKVCALAETYQVVIAPHNTKGPVGIMAAAHVMAAIPNPLIQEFIAPSRIPWRNDVLRQPLEIEDSCLVVPDRPGLGIEFDEAALKPHLVE